MASWPAMKEEIEKVEKLDVARRQLREAILLFYERRDPIAIHALAAAAHQVLHDLARKKGIRSILKDNPYIRPDKRSEVVQMLNVSQNFFKHADRDPDAHLKFRAAATPFYMLDAVEMWGQLKGHYFKEAFVFRLWFLMAHPHVVASEQVQQILEPFRRELGAGVNDFAAIRSAIERFNFGT